MFDYFVFVDESGDLGAKGTPVFVMVAVEVKNERLLERILKRARTKKLRRQQTGDELKASSALPRVRSFILRKIAQTDCRIIVLAVDKASAGALGATQNELYDAACVEVCQNVRGPQTSIVLDKKYVRQADRDKLATTIEGDLKRQNVHATVSHVDSNYRAGLQAADFVAWAAFQKFAKNDDSYLAFLRPKIAFETTSNVAELLRKHAKPKLD